MATPKTVTLVSPDGDEYHSSSPREISQLHYGLGYAFKGKGQTYASALEGLGKDAVYTELPVSPAPEPAPEPTPAPSTKK